MSNANDDKLIKGFSQEETKVLPDVSAKIEKTLLSRDDNGLLPNVTHKFTDDGFVDWKAMIPEKYIVINEDKFKNRGIPTSIKECKDNELLILLGGIKEVAKIRGLVTRSNKVVRADDTACVVECTVEFSPNFETGFRPLIYSDVASCGRDNCSSEIQRSFKESIAANRAFVRAVRNALRIDIVASDELDKPNYKQFSSKNSDEVPMGEESKKGVSTLPWAMLRDSAKTQGFDDFQSFKTRMVERAKEGKLSGIPDDKVESWGDWDKISSIDCFKIMELLKGKKKKV